MIRQSSCFDLLHIQPLSEVERDKGIQPPAHSSQSKRSEKTSIARNYKHQLSLQSLGTIVRAPQYGPSKNPPARQRACQILSPYRRKGKVCGVGKDKQILLQAWLQLRHVLCANLRYRRTGITLKPTARDENGLESIDGLFSSPEKSPVKQTGGNQPSSSDGESMDIGQSKDILDTALELLLYIMSPGLRLLVRHYPRSY